MTELRRIVKNRDNISDDQFDELVEDARVELEDGQDPEEILLQVFGIEPDYIYDLIEEL